MINKVINKLSTKKCGTNNNNKLNIKKIIYI